VFKTKIIGPIQVQFHAGLTLQLDKEASAAVNYVRFVPWETALYSLVGGVKGSQRQLGRVGGRKNLVNCMSNIMSTA